MLNIKWRMLVGTLCVVSSVMVVEEVDAGSWCLARKRSPILRLPSRLFARRACTLPLYQDCCPNVPREQEQKGPFVVFIRREDNVVLYEADFDTEEEAARLTAQLNAANPGVAFYQSVAPSKRTNE